MTFTLKIVSIETKPKAGYYILHNNDILIIKKVIPQREEVKLENGEIMSFSEASKKIAKLIGEVNIEKGDKIITKTYSIIHGDYSRIIASLNQNLKYKDEVADEDIRYINMKEALMDGKSIVYDFEFENILTRTVIDEVVNITNLQIVDKYEIYRKEDRLGVVTKFDNINHIFTIKLNTSGTEVKCKREDFTKIHNDNIIQMLHVLCNYCGK